MIPSLPNDKTQVIALMKAISEYYPVGMNAMRPWFPGYERYNKILTDKINIIISKQRTPWVNLIQDLKADFGNTVLDMDYLQFPSHLLKITLEKESDLHHDFERNLVVNISLLCDFYTIFFEDSFRFKDYTNEIIKPTITITFSYKIGKEDYFRNLINRVECKISDYFRWYTRANHKLLFEYKNIAVNPYSESEVEHGIPYSFYQLLFDSFYKPDCLYTFD